MTWNKKMQHKLSYLKNLSIKWSMFRQKIISISFFGLELTWSYNSYFWEKEYAAYILIFSQFEYNWQLPLSVILSCLAVHLSCLSTNGVLDIYYLCSCGWCSSLFFVYFRRSNDQIKNKTNIQHYIFCRGFRLNFDPS